MIVIDANILLYAHNRQALDYERAEGWLDEIWAGSEQIGLPWLTIWAFLRLSTNSRVWPEPKTPRQACAVVHEWLGQPGVVTLEPGPRHIEILERLIADHGATGPRLTDAVLAAIVLEHGATLATTDRDFARFAGLRWFNPLV